MARVPKGRRRRALRRDDDRCGIHLGGCGRKIQWDNKRIPPGDHIIPQSLFSKVAPDPQEFQEDWNIQPMHDSCGTEKDNRLSGLGMGEMEMLFTSFADTPDKWPLFTCRCHYLQVVGTDLYVCTKGPVSKGKHILYAGFVKDFGESNRQDAIMVVEHWTTTDGRKVVGYDGRGKTARDHILPSISPRRVAEFNLSETIRVGLPFPKVIYRDERGRVFPVTPPT